MAYTLTPFSECNLKDSFFDSLREDYPGFDDWFRGKADKGYVAYVDRDDEGLIHAFVSIKRDLEDGELEGKGASLPAMKRLKISTIKIDDKFKGNRYGEGAMGIALWSWQSSEARQVYVTVFKKHESLINLLTRFGFTYAISMENGERVYVKDKECLDFNDPRKSFPYLNPAFKRAKYLTIWDIYHDKMFQRSELKGVVKPDQDLPVSNGVTKVYIANSATRFDYEPGDIVFMYRSFDDDLPKGNRAAVTSYCTVNKVHKVKQDGLELMEYPKYKDLVKNKSVYSEEDISTIYRKQPNVYLLELIYNGYFGKGNNVNLNALRENDLWKDGHPINTVLSREETIKLLRMGKADVQYLDINKS